MQRDTAWSLVLADALTVLAGFLLAHWLRFGSGLLAAPLGTIDLNQWLLLAVACLPLWLLVFALHGLYYTRLKQAFSAELGSLTHAVAEGMLAAILLTFAWRNLPDSRLALLFAVGLSWLLLTLLRGLRRRLRRQRPQAIVIGDSPLAHYLRRQFAAQGTRFDLISGSADIVSATQAESQRPQSSRLQADAIFCDADQASELWRQLGSGPHATALYFLPQGDAAAGGAVSVATVEGVPTLAVKNTADLAQMRRVKRVIDIVGAVVLLIVSSPVWLVCIVCMLVTMPGPLFFSHERIGLFTRPIRVFKFRSMRVNPGPAPQGLAGFDERYKLQHDPRVTPFGRFMRKWSLDELPQFLNVLLGDLSLVGPRWDPLESTCRHASLSIL